MKFLLGCLKVWTYSIVVQPHSSFSSQNKWKAVPPFDVLIISSFTWRMQSVVRFLWGKNIKIVVCEWNTETDKYLNLNARVCSACWRILTVLTFNNSTGKLVWFKYLHVIVQVYLPMSSFSRCRTVKDRIPKLYLLRVLFWGKGWFWMKNNHVH